MKAEIKAKGGLWVLPVLTVLALQGCMLQGGEDRAYYCGDWQTTVVYSKLLTPADRDFSLSLEPQDSAYTDGVCGVQLQLGFGFDNDSLQALAHSGNVLNMPLAGLSDANVFFMNDTISLGLPTDPRYFSITAPADFQLSPADNYILFPFAPSGPASRGTYSVRTSLSPTVTSNDSSLRVTARIRFHKGY